jgi:hypothetical protein
MINDIQRNIFLPEKRSLFLLRSRQLLKSKALPESTVQIFPASVPFRKNILRFLVF